MTRKSKSKSKAKLSLKKQLIRRLDPEQLNRAAGGADTVGVGQVQPAPPNWQDVQTASCLPDGTCLLHTLRAAGGASHTCATAVCATGAGC